MFDAELLFTACSTTAEAAYTLLTGAVGGLCQLSRTCLGVDLKVATAAAKMVFQLQT